MYDDWPPGPRRGHRICNVMYFNDIRIFLNFNTQTMNGFRNAAIFSNSRLHIFLCGDMYTRTCGLFCFTFFFVISVIVASCYGLSMDGNVLMSGHIHIDVGIDSINKIKWIHRLPEEHSFRSRIWIWILGRGSKDRSYLLHYCKVYTSLWPANYRVGIALKMVLISNFSLSFAFRSPFNPLIARWVGGTRFRQYQFVKRGCVCIYLIELIKENFHSDIRNKITFNVCDLKLSSNLIPVNVRGLEYQQANQPDHQSNVHNYTFTVSIALKQ